MKKINVLLKEKSEEVVVLPLRFFLFREELDWIMSVNYNKANNH